LPTQVSPIDEYFENDTVLDIEFHMYHPSEEHFDHRRLGIDLLNERMYETDYCGRGQSSGEPIHSIVSLDRQSDWLKQTSRSHITEHTMLARRCSTSSSQASTDLASSSVSSTDDECSSYTSETCAVYDEHEPYPERLPYNSSGSPYGDRTSIATEDLTIPSAYTADKTLKVSANPYDHQQSTAVSLTAPAQHAQPLTSTHLVNSSPRMSLSRPTSALSVSSSTSLPLSIASSPWNCLREAHHPLCPGDCDVDSRSTSPTSPKSPTSSWYSSPCSSPSLSSSPSVTSSDSNRSSMISTDYSNTISNDARRYSWLNRPPALVRCTGRKRTGTPLTLNIEGKHAKVVSESQIGGATDLWLEYWRVHA